MKLVSVADRIVFSSIKNFEYGQINLKNYDGKEYKLGNENSSLKANLIINKPGVTLNILNKGFNISLCWPVTQIFVENLFLYLLSSKIIGANLIASGLPVFIISS